jgi:RNA polymerase sigma-70 factor (ECF subfamily)
LRRFDKVSCYISIGSQQAGFSVLGNWNKMCVQGMKQGRNSAFDQCYSTLSPAIYSAILRICINKDTANDLLHDTFVSAFEKIDTFDETQEFVAWIKRIAFNNTFNHLKKSANKSHDIIEDIRLFSPDKSIEQSYENRNLLDTLLNSVSESERLILWLFIVEQYTHEEIASLVEKTASYSKSIISRALKKIQQHDEVERHAL